MAHFAELDENNVVLRVIVVANADTADGDGNEVEAIGAGFCDDLLGGTWKQTSYNNNIRRRFAGKGYTYDADRDAFITPQLFPSWSLDDNHDWQPPADKPFPESYRTDDWAMEWNEETGDWVEIEPVPADDD